MTLFAKLCARACGLLLCSTIVHRYCLVGLSSPCVNHNCAIFTPAITMASHDMIVGSTLLIKAISTTEGKCPTQPHTHCVERRCPRADYSTHTTAPTELSRSCLLAHTQFDTRNYKHDHQPTSPPSTSLHGRHTQHVYRTNQRHSN